AHTARSPPPVGANNHRHGQRRRRTHEQPEAGPQPATRTNGKNSNNSQREKAEAMKESEIREALADLVDAIPGQSNDRDWWPDQLTHAVRKANALLEETEPQP